MKRILLVLVLLCTTMAYSQDKTFESEVKKISRRIDKITQQQKDSLKEKVKEINLKVDNGQLSLEEANKLKKEAADYHANQIEKLVSIEEKRLQLLVQDKTNGKILGEDKYYEESTFSIGGKTFQLRFTDENWEEIHEREMRRQRKRWTRRKTSQFVFAMGANNTLVNHKLSSLDNSPYQFWRSRFYEVGFTQKYRLSEKASKYYLKYGVSFLWNNLRPDNQQYHVLNGKQTEIAVFPGEIGDARLRHVQMIFPLHLEIDFSKDRNNDDGSYRDYSGTSWRLGLGGFVGFKLGTRQYLEYRDANGIKVEEVQKNNFNMNQYNYGLSAYVAHRNLGLYVKYDLNPLFKDTEIRNISMGIRFDFD